MPPSGTPDTRTANSVAGFCFSCPAPPLKFSFRARVRDFRSRLARPRSEIVPVSSVPVVCKESAHDLKLCAWSAFSVFLLTLIFLTRVCSVCLLSVRGQKVCKLNPSGQNNNKNRSSLFCTLRLFLLCPKLLVCFSPGLVQFLRA